MKKYLLTIFALRSLTFFLFSCTNVNDKTSTEENNSNIINNESSNSDNEINNPSSENDNKDNDIGSLNIQNRNCRLFFFDTTTLKLKYIDTTNNPK